MARLTVFAEDASLLATTADTGKINDVLAETGASLRHWDVRDVTGMTDDQVLTAYRDLVSAEQGYVLIDIKHGERAARDAFLAEHTHDDDEVRYFAAGRGAFYLHVAARVYAILCEPGDLLSVPAGTRHWFDMGTRSDFTVIRFFREPEGWVGDFTGDPIARRIPSFDALTLPLPVAGGIVRHEYPWTFALLRRWRSVSLRAVPWWHRDTPGIRALRCGPPAGDLGAVSTDGGEAYSSARPRPP